VIVTLSDEFPELELVRPELSAVGEALSHGELDVVVHVRVDPGAPIFVIDTDPFVGLPPAVALSGNEVGLRTIPAFGSHSTIKFIVASGVRVCTKGLLGG
jgi:hypothetical protein